MEKRKRMYYLAHPSKYTETKTFSKNIFMQSIREENECQLDQLDRFIAGAKDVRIYKNRMKRKKKLTAGFTNNSKGRDSIQSKELLNSQEVIECLPKSPLHSQHIKSTKSIHLKSISALSSPLNIKSKESSLISSIHLYRCTVQERQKTSKLNYLPKTKSQLWMNTLRQHGKNRQTQHIVGGRKMMLCGSSKKKIEQKWLQSKENEGYGFQLIPQTFIKSKNNALQ